MSLASLVFGGRLRRASVSSELLEWASSETGFCTIVYCTWMLLQKIKFHAVQCRCAVFAGESWLHCAVWGPEPEPGWEPGPGSHYMKTVLLITADQSGRLPSNFLNMFKQSNMEVTIRHEFSGSCSEQSFAKILDFQHPTVQYSMVLWHVENWLHQCTVISFLCTLLDTVLTAHCPVLNLATCLRTKTGYIHVTSFCSWTCFEIQDRKVSSRSCVLEIAQKTGYIHVTSFGSRTCTVV